MRRGPVAMASAALGPLCLCWALGPAAAATPNILLLLMDDVSAAPRGRG